MIGMNGSKISRDDIQHVALLSRLAFSEQEIDSFTRELNSILDYFTKLNELDTSNVQPTSHSIEMTNVFREDARKPSLTPEEALSNAPDQENGCFKVPKIIQEQ